LNEAGACKQHNAESNTPSPANSMTKDSGQLSGFVDFDPDKDIPSLQGKVIFITGGECRHAWCFAGLAELALPLSPCSDPNDS
jgi:hypothetical protein